jgi:hypothetical protein
MAFALREVKTITPRSCGIEDRRVQHSLPIPASLLTGVRGSTRRNAGQPPSLEVAKSMALPMGSSPPAAAAALEAAMVKKSSAPEGALLY